MCILDIFICSKASSIAFASGENINASYVSRAENTFLFITEAAATLSLSFEPSVKFSLFLFETRDFV